MLAVLNCFTTVMPRCIYHGVNPIHDFVINYLCDYYTIYDM